MPYSQSSANGNHYARIYFRVATLPSADNCVAQIQASGTTVNVTNTNCYYIVLTSTGTLKLYTSGGTLIGTSVSSLSLNTWYRIELHWYRNSGGGGGDILNLYVDGALVVGATNLTHGGGAGSFACGGNLKNEAQTQGEWYFDDFAINNDTGTVQNSFPGAGSIIHLYPNANGDFTEGSLTGAATAWQSVATLDDSTSYWTLIVDSPGSISSDRLDVHVEDFVEAHSAITLVQIGFRASNDGTASSTFILRCKTQAAGTLSESSSIAWNPLNSNWFTHDDTSNSRQYKLTRYTDPQAGGAWTDSLLDSMQIGVRCTDANPDGRITFLWALVEYIPSASSGITINADLLSSTFNQPSATPITSSLQVESGLSSTFNQPNATPITSSLQVESGLSSTFNSLVPAIITDSIVLNDLQILSINVNDISPLGGATNNSTVLSLTSNLIPIYEGSVEIAIGSLIFTSNILQPSIINHYTQLVSDQQIISSIINPNVPSVTAIQHALLNLTINQQSYILIISADVRPKHINIRSNPNAIDNEPRPLPVVYISSELSSGYWNLINSVDNYNN